MVDQDYALLMLKSDDIKSSLSINSKFNKDHLSQIDLVFCGYPGDKYNMVEDSKIHNKASYPYEKKAILIHQKDQSDKILIFRNQLYPGMSGGPIKYKEDTEWQVLALLSRTTPILRDLYFMHLETLKLRTESKKIVDRPMFVKGSSFYSLLINTLDQNSKIKLKIIEDMKSIGFSEEELNFLMSFKGDQLPLPLNHSIIEKIEKVGHYFPIQALGSRLTEEKKIQIEKWKKELSDEDSESCVIS